MVRWTHVYRPVCHIQQAIFSNLNTSRSKQNEIRRDYSQRTSAHDNDSNLYILIINKNVTHPPLSHQPNSLESGTNSKYN